MLMILASNCKLYMHTKYSSLEICLNVHQLTPQIKKSAFSPHHDTSALSSRIWKKSANFLFE